jgi:hypothetical protein
MLKTVITIACACVLLTTAGQAGDPQTLKGNAAFGDWRDDKPGVKRLPYAKRLASGLDSDLCGRSNRSHARRRAAAGS